MEEYLHFLDKTLGLLSEEARAKLVQVQYFPQLFLINTDTHKPYFKSYICCYSSRLRFTDNNDDMSFHFGGWF